MFNQLGQAMAEMDTITGENLVASLTAQQYFETRMRFRADEIGGNCGGVRDRFIQMPNDFGKEVDNIWLEHDLVVVRAELFCDQASELRVFIRLLETTVLRTITNGVRRYRFGRDLCH